MFIQYEIIIKGAIFCQVIKIIFEFHVSPSITLGSQKWNGAAPVFINIVEEIKTIVNFSKLGAKLIKNKLIIIVNKNTAEAKAWIKKYLREDSEENKFFDLIIKGIKDNKLISNPIHILNQEFAEIVINVPEIKEMKKRNL